MGFTQQRFNAIIDGDNFPIGLWSGIVAQHIIYIVGIRPNHSDCLVLAQWQDAVVLEQRDGLLCRLSRYNDGIGIIYFFCSRFGINIRMLKKPHLKFQSQYPSHGLIEHVFSYHAILYSIDKIRVAVSAQIHVNTCEQSLNGGILL